MIRISLLYLWDGPGSHVKIRTRSRHGTGSGQTCFGGPVVVAKLPLYFFYCLLMSTLGKFVQCKDANNDSEDINLDKTQQLPIMAGNGGQRGRLFTV